MCVASAPNPYVRSGRVGVKHGQQVLEHLDEIG
eukprot:CAMPEP_0113662974 /NCGR_PEP_ID=MMETSP0038_2-20120614/880_1 /TAXON_ID=2898 /ORGANISM="Cryptomonas paramecium" /LENGTH=32 /DNA_ID=CAMNT_0000577941 /DNA_START=543 /DNA_END=641 /DNA_ORIENTATION=+ /assembly_acc=CAM_ASM_000170